MVKGNDRAGGRGRLVVGVLAAVLGLGGPVMPAVGQEKPTVGQEKPAYEVWDFGVAPRPSVLGVLIDLEAVQKELGVNEEQKKQRPDIERQWGEMQRLVRQARRETKDPEKLRAAQAAAAVKVRETIRRAFRPEQWERLGQIQLQAQGPLAFDRDGAGPRAAVQNVDDPLPDRLKLSEDQRKRIKPIVEEGNKEISRAASFPIPLDPEEKPSKEAIRKYVESPEFRAAKQKASQDAREAWAAVIRRIEEVLTEEQRRDYHRMLGAPFDVSRLEDAKPEQVLDYEANRVARALGLGGGGQRADPDFKTKVDRPAYAGVARHPRVLFDEAHHNFHTAGGRYKPFAELIASDGYEVIPNREAFTRESLKKGDVLVIANALKSEDWEAGAAFTDAECDAVRDWVKDGGSLLLITDHAPFGGAAQGLASRFGVSLSTGAVSDPQNSEGGDSFLVFSRQNQLLGDHPITRGRDDSERLNKIQTFTGTSLKGPEGSVAILKLADTAVDNAVGGEEAEGTSAGGRAQGVALAFGRGRVVVMGEAAELSAQVVGLDDRFGMNVKGIDNRQMALNILHWLSGLLEPREAALKKAG